MPVVLMLVDMDSRLANHRVIRAVGLATVMACVLALPVPANASGAPRTGDPLTAEGQRPKGSQLDPNASARARHLHFTNTGHVGDVVAWPASETDDDGVPSYYLKDFRLRAVSPHLEVWTPVGDGVSTGLDFPEGDCRNGDTTIVTDAQIDYLVDQFERVIRPREADVFGLPTKRDGKDATLPSYVSSIPRNAYRAPGDRVVALVDNFRDAFFRGTGAGNNGFVDDVQMRFVDRNVVNLRGLGWAWKLGDHPRADVAGDDACTGRAGIPHGVEGALAHEYNHVLQASAGTDFEAFYNDPGWLAEGLATWASHLTGYVDTTTNSRSNFFVECFYGEWSVRPPNPILTCPGGASHSLSSTGEFGQDRRAGYGAAESFMELLDSRYGHTFMHDLLWTTGVWGRDKVDKLLADRGIAATFNDLVSDWSASIALDGVLDDGAQLVGGDADRFQVAGLHAGVAWDSPFADESQVPGDPPTMRGLGVAPNGSDFTRLRDGGGTWLDASQLHSLDFDGETHLDCLWTVDPNGHGAGDAALYSGTGDEQNRAIETAVDVASSDPSLEFDTKYQTEQGWDFAYVQVSTDDGATWQSQPATTTTTGHDPNAAPEIVSDLPGFTGDSGGWVHEHVDLSRYAGRHVRIAFRYRTDPGIARAGYWIDNVTVGGQPISDGTTVAPFENIFLPVYKLQLRLVSYTDDHQVASIADVPLDTANNAHLDAAALQTLVAPGAQTVAAIITFIQPNPELCRVRYTLSVNGVVQPGG